MYFLLLAEREEFEPAYDLIVHRCDGGADGILQNRYMPVISIQSAVSRTTGEAGKSLVFRFTF